MSRLKNQEGSPMIEEVTILPGLDKDGRPEDFDCINLRMGEAASIVGPTGSGKTALITDLELLAQGDTATRRRVLINGGPPPEEMRHNPLQKPVAMITQNTKCFTDLSVEDFLRIHARARGIEPDKATGRTITLANRFTGEKIAGGARVTVLSGGQTRALLIADALLIGAAPVILLDEIENAGIFKQEVVGIIRDLGKIVVFVTHDPVIALLTGLRIIMENGAIKRVIVRDEAERGVAQSLIAHDRRMGLIRERLRAGQVITAEEFAGLEAGVAPA